MRLQQTMQKYIRDYYEQLYGNKMDNQEEMDRNRNYEQPNYKH